MDLNKRDMRKNVDIERRLRNALANLRAGSPQHSSLKARAKEGARLINISNVALEAGVSRTLIGHVNCNYPELRKEILQAASEQSTHHSVTAMRTELRREIRFLKTQIEMKDTYIAELLLEIDRLGGGTRGSHESVIDFRAKRRQRRTDS